jgi:hypothetical protein
MERMNRLVVKLHPAERAVIERLADAEQLAASTLTRKVLLDLARLKGITAGQDERERARSEP